MPMLSLSLLYSANAYIAFDFIAFANLRKTMPPQCGSLHYIAVAVHHLTLRFPCVTSPIIALARQCSTPPLLSNALLFLSSAIYSMLCLCTASQCYAVPCLCCTTLVRCCSVTMLRITPRYVTMPLQSCTQPRRALPLLIGTTPSFAIALLRLYQPVLVLPRHSRVLYSQAVAN